MSSGQKKPSLFPSDFPYIYLPGTSTKGWMASSDAVSDLALSLVFHWTV